MAEQENIDKENIMATATFWIQENFTNRALENVQAETPEQAIYSEFGVHVTETGPVKFDFATKSVSSGYRYWIVVS
ncbi:hypothetical protein [Shewanella algae]|uniref:hypothetical protein n=1 Tax=Shewanella algae TaxID=38313 RepID=UPI00118248D0|nr:hypothetical protein [Shewanella algae]MBO2558926.1 hypothetical protein [Shewanella algae]MBO2575921.1 hypothetical protein [Shewanella algae]